MVCACMAASKTRSLVFTDDVTADRSSTLKCIELYFLLRFGQMLQN